MDTTISSLIRSNPRNPYLLVGSSIAATLAVIAVARLALRTPSTKIIRSPRDVVVSKLSGPEQDDLPYPPDVFPGARDVRSPYGSIRVYEYGPDNGRKVLLLHGITTPCLSLGSIANALVEKGCRVMIMDLFGRGYSDSPDLPHDPRLYCTQILLALTSSPLAWTPEGFGLIGYSFGGGIAVDFAVHFPDLVKDIALLAPGGLIRSHHFGWKSRLVYASFVPDLVVHTIVGRRLRGASVQGSSTSSSDSKTEETDKVVSAEIKGNRDPSFESAPLSKTRPGITVASAVSWQVENHEGFVRSFVSSIKCGSIEGQEEVWKKLRGRKEKILIIAGRTDSVIVARELREDVIEAVGEENMEWRIIEGGHEFPITKGEEVVSIVSEIWKL